MPPRSARVLVVAAHPDDECVGASYWLMQRDAAVVVLTGGAPRDARWFGRGHGWNAALYRQVRRRECCSALRRLGVAADSLLQGHIVDQELGRQLHEGLKLLRVAARRFRPRVMVVPAYEGGHPDHDAVSFLAAWMRRRGLAPTVRHWWEYALYRRQDGRVAAHDLPAGAGRHYGRMCMEEEQSRRRALAEYRSQAETLRWLAPFPECFRPMPEYDFRQRPTPGRTVYEQWGMAWTAEELCRRFGEFGERESERRTSSWVA